MKAPPFLALLALFCLIAIGAQAQQRNWLEVCPGFRILNFSPLQNISGNAEPERATNPNGAFSAGCIFQRNSKWFLGPMYQYFGTRTGVSTLLPDGSNFSPYLVVQHHCLNLEGNYVLFQRADVSRYLVGRLGVAYNTNYNFKAFKYSKYFNAYEIEYGFRGARLFTPTISAGFGFKGRLFGGVYGVVKPLLVVSPFKDKIIYQNNIENGVAVQGYSFSQRTIVGLLSVSLALGKNRPADAGE